MLRLGLFSYWINSYSGGGLIAAFGGALVLGALPRWLKAARFRYGLLMAVGIILLATTRPYEGLLLCLPVALVLGRWGLVGKTRPSVTVLLRNAAFPLALIVSAGAWMGWYDYRAFGSPFTLPYTVDRATYAMAPYYVWQSPRPAPVYRHEELRRFYSENELAAFNQIHSLSGFVPHTVGKAAGGLLFFTGLVLLPPLMMLRRVLLDRRIRFLVLCVLVMMAGMLIEIFMLAHYVAPFTAAFYAIGLQAMRHLRLWSPEGKPVGAQLVRLTVTLCLILAGLRVFAEPFDEKVVERPPSGWINMWYGPEFYGAPRARIEAQLEHLPGKQLVIVRYAPHHNPMDEWVYNAADIDGSKVVWAREMDAANNIELIHYYPDREVWLVEPDLEPAKPSPFPMPAQGVSAPQ